MQIGLVLSYFMKFGVAIMLYGYYIVFLDNLPSPETQKANMTQFIKFTLIALLLSIFVSCKKEGSGQSLTPEQQQQQEEEKAVLLPNEILEKEGLRFTLNYSTVNAQIALKLYKGTTPPASPIALTADQEFVNYSVLAGQLEGNSDFTLVVEYVSVTNNGSFDLSVIGFTDINETKSFTISNHAFTTADEGINKNFLRIHKGITKYTFSTLQ